MFHPFWWVLADLWPGQTHLSLLRFVTKGGVGYGVDETQKACWGVVKVTSVLKQPWHDNV